jgi:ubiquitin-protein ligase
MASELSSKRLRKELRDLQKKPMENIRAAPLENNILEWHYVIEGYYQHLYFLFTVHMLFELYSLSS